MPHERRRREATVRISRCPRPKPRWHTRPGALERLTPPWEPMQVLERTGDGITDGARVTLGIRLGPLRWRWVEHCGYRQDEQFCDVQIAGPFACWEHAHRFAPDGASACYLEDRVTYALPLGVVAQRCAGSLVRRKLDRLFALSPPYHAAGSCGHTRPTGRTNLCTSW